MSLCLHRAIAARPQRKNELFFTSLRSLGDPKELLPHSSRSLDVSSAFIPHLQLQCQPDDKNLKNGCCTIASDVVFSNLI